MFTALGQNSRVRDQHVQRQKVRLPIQEVKEAWYGWKSVREQGKVWEWQEVMLETQVLLWRQGKEFGYVLITKRGQRGGL